MLKGNVASSLALAFSIAAAAVAVPACTGDTTPSGDAGPDAGPPLGDGGTAPEADGGPPVINCPKPTGGPTTHSGDIKGEEVWTAAASPHVVTYDVNVRDGAKLVIEPCAEVLFEEDTHINVAFPLTPNTGTLLAEGAADKPIRFAGKDGAKWGNVFVHAPGTARFKHVTFENGGNGRFQDRATLYVTGDGEAYGEPIVLLDHVTIRKSAGAAVWMDRAATFMPGSQELVITESGNETHPYPIEIEEWSMDALPTGRYTGNVKDEILLEPMGNGVAGEGLTKDATLHDRGVPYHVGTSSAGGQLVVGGADGTVTTLTIEPGVKLRFTPGTAFQIQHFTTDKPSTGVVRAVGTAAKPIVFTSAADSPKAGDWRGLWFGGIPQATNQIQYARIEYAGADCGCSLNTCSAIAEHEGAVIFTQQPPSAFITNTVFSNVTGHGITEGFDGTLVNFRPTNTFEAVSGCVQTRPRNVDTSCPAPKPACDGL